MGKSKPKTRWSGMWMYVVIVLLFLLLPLVLWGNRDRFFGTPVSDEAFEKFKTDIHSEYEGRKWKQRAPFDRKLDRETLLESFEKGRDYLIANQKPAGNFNYEYDFTTQQFTPGDNEVRQAGALWGLALCNQFQPTSENAAALQKGLEYFISISQTYGDNGAIVRYPGYPFVMTGTVALTTLALIDTLNSLPEPDPKIRSFLHQQLDKYLEMLKSQQFRSGEFSLGVVGGIDMKVGQGNPYFNGESLLALSKAARYADRDDLIPSIEKAARTLVKKYTLDAWAKEPDSTRTKGFYQWGSMAFTEYYQAEWKDREAYGDAVLAMAHWMIHTHRTLKRSRNTGYAYEGLIHALLIARERDDEAAIQELEYTIDRGLYKLTSWQVEGPLVNKNRFLRRNRTSDPLAVGGVMNHRREAPLRIDVAQHQMHAVILALKHVYTK